MCIKSTKILKKGLTASFGDVIMCMKGHKREYLRKSDQLEGTKMNPKEISLEMIIWAARKSPKRTK